MIFFWNRDRSNYFTASFVAGSYVSACGRYGATLRPPGMYPLGPDFSMIKMARHYAVRIIGNPGTIGTARTLKEAAETYLY